MCYDDIGHFIVPPYGRSLEDINQVQYSFDDVSQHTTTLIKTGLDIDNSFEIERDLSNLEQDYETLDIDKVFNSYISSELKIKFLSSFIKSGCIDIIIQGITQDISLLIDQKPDLDSHRIKLNDISENYINSYKNSLCNFTKNEDNNYIISDHICGQLFNHIVTGSRIKTVGETIISSYSLIYEKVINLYSSDSEYYDNLSEKGIFDQMAQSLNSIYYLILNGLIIERMIAYDILKGLELSDDDSLDNYKDTEAFNENAFSTEKDHAFANIGGLGDKTKSLGTNKGISSAAQYFQNTSATLNSVKKKFNLYTRKNKNYFFYRRYLGRIEHLYERYGQDASILENRMKDDPVQILNGSAKEYIQKYTSDNIKIYKQVEALIQKVENAAPDAEACLKILKPFLGPLAINIKGIKKLPKLMIKATKRHIAEALLENNRVYGYTVESIVEKNFPPPNHTIVALFVENSHEKPTEQSVSSIITDVDSFRLIAANSKKPIFEISEISQKLLRDGVSPGSLNSLMSNLRKSGLKGKKDVGEAPNGDKVDSKNMKIIIKSLEGSLNYIAHMKSYGSKLVEQYFSMMMRIDNMCKLCVKAMLNIERQAKDERHDTGFKGTKLKAHKGYSQKEDNYISAGQKEFERNQEDPKEVHRNRVNEMKRAMSEARGVKWI